MLEVVTQCHLEPPPSPSRGHPAPHTPSPRVGYFGGRHRYGQMATTVLDTSNTLLHAAKAVHATGLPRLVPLQDVMFKLFALVGGCRGPGAEATAMQGLHSFAVDLIGVEWSGVERADC